MEPGALAIRIRDVAFDLGFDLVGVAPAGPSPDYDRFCSWLDRGYQAEMAYLARRAADRADPRTLLAESRTVIVVGASYFTASMPQPAERAGLPADPSRGRIASYAWGDDYHEALKALLFELDAAIRVVSGRTTLGRAYVDTGPVLERSWATAAGLGYIGKNTCLISPRLGSWLFLGVLLVPENVEGGGWTVERGGWRVEREERRDSKQVATHLPGFTCGACTRCLDACPTQAFIEPHVLDARRCISYLTIELAGPIPYELRSAMGSWVFGCDACQDVCPYNRRFALPTRLSAFQPRPEAVMPALLDLLALDDAGFRQRFRNSPVRRAKRRGLARNVCVALGNWGDPLAIPALTATLHDAEPLIRGHAAWALGQIGQSSGANRPESVVSGANRADHAGNDAHDDSSLAPAGTIWAALEARLASEHDAYVQSEIRRALTFRTASPVSI